MFGNRERMATEGHHLSRRRLLHGAALAGGAIAATGFAGCGGTGKRVAPNGQASGPTRAGEQPKRGGVLNYAGGKAGSQDVQGKGFDPYVIDRSPGKGYTLFYERLLGYDLQTYALRPELAQKWEQPSQTEYLFHLQPGVKWHNKPPVNGRALTTDDVLWSLERARTNDPKFYSRSFLTSIDKIEAPDATTVRLTTKLPDASTLTKFSVDNLAILAREVFDKYSKLTTADSIVGTGAFMAKSIEQNVAGEYVRNPDYWRPGEPYLDSFRTKAFADTLTSYSAFLAGQVDITLMPGTGVKEYIAHQGPGFTPAWYADDTCAELYPNTKVKPMDDARTAKALRLLLDHDELASAWAAVQFGKGGYGSVFCPALSAWDLTADEYRAQVEWKQPKDPAIKEALSLLGGAGFNKVNPLKFTLYSYTTPEYAAGAQLIQAQWNRLGQGTVNVELKLFDSATVDGIRAQRQFTYAFFGLGAGMPDPDIWLSSGYHSGGSLNFMGFGDPQADAMIDKQRTIFDDKQRKAAVKETILYLIDHSPSVIPANRFFLDAVQPKVRNHVPEYYLNGGQYHSVWLAE